jgi:hypothetical protein
MNDIWITLVQWKNCYEVIFWSTQTLLFDISSVGTPKIYATEFLI